MKIDVSQPSLANLYPIHYYNALEIRVKLTFVLLELYSVDLVIFARF